MEKSLISFDYAIKYLLKDKRDFDIIEGFISALLNTVGYSDVKIAALLDTESNKESSKAKRSLADLVVEDKAHHKYVVEIERNVHPHFIHKACFNTSRLLVDTLGEGQDYGQILKIFHISLLYFPIGEGSGVAYHGKTLIREVTTGEKLTLHITDPATNQVYDATGVLPEYFYISIPSFNDRLEKELDEWLYVMKHDEVHKNSRSKYMKKIAKKLSVLKMTDEERVDYYSYLKKVYTDRDQLLAYTDEGRKEGREEIRKEIAKKMLAAGYKPDEIARLTDLSLEQISKLPAS
jgi:predicted transposase/invertase (TIGR01784 family)